MPKMHRNAFGGRAPSGPAGGAFVLPRSPSRSGAYTTILFHKYEVLQCKSTRTKKAPEIRSHAFWRYINLYVRKRKNKH